MKQIETLELVTQSKVPTLFDPALLYENPFLGKINLSDCSYLGIKDKTNPNPCKRKLKNLITGQDALAIDQHLHNSLRGMCMHSHYPCPGAQMVFLNSDERIAVFEGLTDNNIYQVCFSLSCYILEYLSGDTGNDLTFILMFKELRRWTKGSFRKHFWKFLKNISQLQDKYYPYAKGYSPVLKDKNFSFSFGEVANYIAAFFADSPRVTRRFAYTALIFNPHDQFNKLKESGKFVSFQKSVDIKDHRLQGSNNESLTDFGEQSEWPQYDSIDGSSGCPINNFVKTNKLFSFLNQPPLKSLL